MSDIAIRVENLYKEYRLGAISHGTLRQDLQSGWAKFRGKEDPNVTIDPINREQLNITSDRFYALNNVSFDVRQGEVVGIVGRNGAGKSTLLKIISRVTAPSKGSIKIKGRVASLLEVGTGFHPELTGRENVFLNGAILGMRKGEIEQKFDEIVRFAEIDKFIDTPVKRYSSGMYVRLAFAVAAHLESEILLVDEVLAVGDAAFQQKCLRKMGEVVNEGRTVLFVSHQMNTIRKLCPRSILIENGRIEFYSDTNEVITNYEREMSANAKKFPRSANNNKIAQFLAWEVVKPVAENKNYINTFAEIEFKISLLIKKQISHVHHGIDIWDKENHLIWGWCTDIPKLDAGYIEFYYLLPVFPLKPGNYYLHTSLYSEQILLDEWNGLPALTINTLPVSHPRDEFSGILNVPCNFKINNITQASEIDQNKKK
jgi:lipopolysaccharide transport system ATP-binding protein